MKNKLMLLPLLLSTYCFSQDVNKEIDTRIDQRVGTIINAKIDSFANTLETVLYRTRTITGTQNIDTLTAALNMSETYRISIKGSLRAGVKDVIVSNTNGTYTVTQKNTANYIGPVGSSWNVIIQNNKAVVTITTPSVSTYSYKKY